MDGKINSIKEDVENNVSESNKTQKTMSELNKHLPFIINNNKQMPIMFSIRADKKDYEILEDEANRFTINDITIKNITNSKVSFRNKYWIKDNNVDENIDFCTDKKEIKINGDLGKNEEKKANIDLYIKNPKINKNYFFKFYIGDNTNNSNIYENVTKESIFINIIIKEKEDIINIAPFDQKQNNDDQNDNKKNDDQNDNKKNDEEPKKPIENKKVDEEPKEPIENKKVDEEPEEPLANKKVDEEPNEPIENKINDEKPNEAIFDNKKDDEEPKKPVDNKKDDKDPKEVINPVPRHDPQPNDGELTEEQVQKIYDEFEDNFYISTFLDEDEFKALIIEKKGDREFLKKYVEDKM